MSEQLLPEASRRPGSGPRPVVPEREAKTVDASLFGMRLPGATAPQDVAATGAAEQTPNQTLPAADDTRIVEGAALDAAAPAYRILLKCECRGSGD